LIKEAHTNAKEHGWWDNPKSIGELLALIHSEVSEALEEHRNGYAPNETYYSGKYKMTIPTNLGIGQTKEYVYKEFNNNEQYGFNKPEGIPSELADIVIRVADICGYYGIDLQAAIDEKMEYNKSRPHKHGGKKL
jgi:NTP pyrophosphatase (non-canonical NTP hydrolase)